MDKMISKALKPMAAAIAAGALALGAMTAPARAQDTDTQQYIPTIWIDPDGCEHWVMDDGAEGYMDARQTRDGRPVCHRNVCGAIPSDNLFSTGSATLSASGRSYLQKFFQSAQARSFIITGHTDARGSDEANMNLSKRRAEAVAKMATSVGAPILAVNWYGERQPRSTNATAKGMSENRRVEVICVK